MPTHRVLTHEQLVAEMLKAQRDYERLSRRVPKRSERRDRGENPVIVLRNQKIIMGILAKEKNRLAQDMQLLTSGTNAGKDAEETEDLMNLTYESDKYDTLIHKEKQQLAEIHEQILNTERIAAALRRQNTTNHKSLNLQLQNAKIVRGLNDRLYTMSVKWNTTLAQNSALRGEIKHMVRERARFNSLFNTLLDRLVKSKLEMTDKINAASMNFDHRDEWQGKLRALRKRGQVDFLIHSEEMRELNAQYDHGVKQKNFLAIKGQRRYMKDLHERQAKLKKEQKEEKQRKLADFKHIMALMADLAEDSNLYNILSRFIKIEMNNFGLYYYVNHVNHEVDMLRSDVEKLRESIETSREEKERVILYHQGKIANMQQLFEEERRRADAAQDTVQGSNAYLTELMQDVEYIFNLTRCDNSPLLELLGQEKNVDLHNVMQHLGIIEKRATDLVTATYYAEREFLSPEELKFEEQSTIDLGEYEERFMVVKQYRFGKLRHIDVRVSKEPCLNCVEIEMQVDESVAKPMTPSEAAEVIEEKLRAKSSLVHTLSACRMPKFRKIVRRQEMDEEFDED